MRKFLLFFLLALSQTFIIKAQIPDSVTSALKTFKANEDTLVVKYLTDYVNRCSNKDVAQVANDSVFKFIYKKLNENSEPQRFYIRYLGLYCHNKALMQIDLGNYLIAEKFKLAALRLYAAIADTVMMVDVMNDLGYDKVSEADYGKALDLYLKAQTLAEKTNYQKGLGVTLNNIGACYKNQGEYDKALDYYKRAYKIRVLVNDGVGLAVSVNNIGFIMKKQHKLDSAMYYYRISLNQRYKNGIETDIANQLSNIGVLHADMGNKDSALFYYTKAYEIRKNAGEVSGMINSLINLSNFYFGLDQNAKGFEYGTRCLELSAKSGYVYEQSKAADLLSDMYEYNGDYKSALKMQKLFKHLSDSLYNDQTQQDFNRSILNSEYEKKELEIKHQSELKEKENEAKLKRQRIITFSTIFGIILTIVFLVVLYNRFKTIKKQKLVIEAQKETVEHQNEEIEEKNKVLEEQKTEILDSISYARRIQTAFLPSEKSFSEYFSDAFVLFRPKDIVSGDFFWITKTDTKIIYVTADCTGHGVPGGFMSMLGMALLNEIVNERKITAPDKILNALREKIIYSLKQTGEANQSKDGMDAVVILVDLATRKMQYAAANNGFYILRKGEFLDFKADKMPVGYYGEDSQPFTLKEEILEQGDIIYTFSDGYADQFGGPKGKKFKYKQMEEKIISVSGKPLAEQKEALLQAHIDWKGNLEQVDDVLMIGIKI